MGTREKWRLHKIPLLNLPKGSKSSRSKLFKNSLDYCILNGYAAMRAVWWSLGVIIPRHGLFTAQLVLTLNRDWLATCCRLRQPPSQGVSGFRWLENIMVTGTQNEKTSLLNDLGFLSPLVFRMEHCFYFGSPWAFRFAWCYGQRGKYGVVGPFKYVDAFAFVLVSVLRCLFPFPHLIPPARSQHSPPIWRNKN